MDTMRVFCRESRILESLRLPATTELFGFKMKLVDRAIELELTLLLMNMVHGRNRISANFEWLDSVAKICLLCISLCSQFPIDEELDGDFAGR